MNAPGLGGAFARHAVERPASVALSDDARDVTWGDLPALVDAGVAHLRALGLRSVALLAANGVEWVLLDLAAIDADVPLLPLPSFFSDEQLRHALATLRPDALLTDDAGRARRLLGADLREEPWSDALRLVRLPDPAAPPPRTGKVTFTSGSTGRPKGVRLTTAGQAAVADALRVASGMHGDDRHLCTLPLAVLLEDVAGVQRTLLAGGTVVLPRLADLGVAGSSSIDGARLAHALDARGATSAIFTPEVLAAFLAALDAGAPRPRALRFVGVGGAAVPPALLRAAESRGVPAFEGYGLSEATSVVALNAPGAARIGSVGRPLSHVEVRVDDQGEVFVRGPGVSPGYVGEPDRPVDAWLPTGDLGALDGDGFLHLRGRIKNLFVTSFGRNVSPEWIERLLLGIPGVRQAAVFGEGRPGPVAVVATDLDDEAVERALVALDARLPDYARLRGWTRAREPFSLANGQWLATGRPRRDAILAAYERELSARSRAPLLPTPSSG